MDSKDIAKYVIEEGLAYVKQFRKQNGDEAFFELIGQCYEELEPFSVKQLEELQSSINQISKKVFKSYIPEIKEFYLPCPPKEQGGSVKDRLRMLKIDRWVTNPAEQDLDKLKNTYNVLSSSSSRFALVFHRTMLQCDVYMAVFSTENLTGSIDPSASNALVNRFAQALQGNFPGATISSYPHEIPGLFQSKGTPKNAVALVSNVATEKSEKFVSQGIEKLIDAYTPVDLDSEYTLMLVCEPLPHEEIEKQREAISGYYTALSPFITWQSNENRTKTLGNMRSVSTGRTFGGGISAGVTAGVHMVGNVSAGVSRQDQNAVNEAASQGQAFTLSYTNHQVKTLLHRLDEQMTRLQQCEALGMWRFSAYVVSNEYAVAENIAQMYRSLTQGESSFVENSAVNVWGNLNGKNESVLQNLISSISRLEHPSFKQSVKDEQEEAVYATSFVSGVEVAQALNMPRKSISGLPVIECAQFAREVIRNIGLGDAFATKSRQNVEVGNIFYMRKETKTPVGLDVDSFASHTFVTGSTGSGKSNTIYGLLNKLCLTEDKTIKFLVIEPAKGEYKDVFGGNQNVSVYGTNPKKSMLLRLNPFSFPDEIHVLEHIDRLIEIFNACWPMYAAMPAVLKASMEKAYANVGWSLTASTCATGRFPTFQDVMRALPEVVDSKGFSKDTQGDYKGALLTRLESLTNGIHGQVLGCADELRASQLFDENVIVDLSRVGSMETKALLMGILVLKLQEHRMAQREAGTSSANSSLRHITVLEEAHHLLRRTSTEQSQDSSNLQGKSVEMITNAIAELRSFGEGFVIADQSPGLLDMAVIRNTNTKIIMRLPDESDRVLVGKGAALNDEQIAELSKLETGVAAIYQNDWLEPVLCKIEKFDNNSHTQQNTNNAFNYKVQQLPLIQEVFLENILSPYQERKKFSKDEIDQIGRWIDFLPTGGWAKQLLFRSASEDIGEKNIGYALYCAVKGKGLLEQLRSERSTEQIAAKIDAHIMDQFHVNENVSAMVREMICCYAAQQVQQDEMYASDLRNYARRSVK